MMANRASPFEHVQISQLVADGRVSIFTGPFGSSLHAHDYVPVGVPVIPTEAIGRRLLRTETVPRVTPETAERLARYKVRANDILFARRGVQATGYSAVAFPKHEGWIAGTGTIVLRVHDNAINPAYLSFVLASDEAIAWLKSHAVGAVMPNLNSEIIGGLPLRLPPPQVQQAIAEILSALDDKVELNRRMNETLEGMARAIFKSWFVTFDPVRTKAGGRQPSGMDADTAALFPDTFQGSCLGSVPLGWQTCRWGDIATLEYGKSLRGYEAPTGRHRVYGTNGPIGWHGEALCDTAGVIIGRKGAYRGVHYSPHPFFVIDTAFYLKPKADIDIKWAYYELLRLDINGMDSGSAIPSTSREDFYNLPVILPPPEILRRFGQVSQPLFDNLEANNQQGEKLAAVRDALLPKLLSGEVRCIRDLVGGTL